MMTCRPLVLFILFAAMLPSLSNAQELLERRAADLQETRAPERPPRQNLEAVTLERQVKPAFIINPLVHRLAARRGQLLDFEFKIEANARPTRLEIYPVSMVQQEHGAIMPDPAAAAPDVIQLLSNPTASLQVGESHTIRCRMRIPPGNAPFLSYGVLVRELPAEPTRNNDASDKPRLGIKFLTQYLLRADIQVIGAQGESVAELEIENGRMASRDGNAAMLAYINNPTDTPMEFEVRSHLVSMESGRRVSSQLWMPVRATQPEPDRYRVRILGKTRLRLEGTLTESVFPGTYQLELELLYRRRIYRKASFPVLIRTGDFPAQDATIVRVTRDIAIEPPHVELSLRKGGSRIQSITVVNGSKQKVVARITPQPLEGELHNWISFRPDELELEPGQKRKVLVVLGSKRNFEEHTYAMARVSVSPEIGEAIGTQNIPIALLTRSESTPEVTAGTLNWRGTQTTAGFEVPVRNTGRQHLKLQGSLTLRDEFGRGFAVEDGYGRWVLPNSEDKLWFAFPQIPPPGTYNVRAAIEQGEGREPVVLEQTIQLKTELEERVSRRLEGSAQN